MSEVHDSPKLEQAVAGLYRASALLGEYAAEFGGGRDPLRAVRDAEATLERRVEALTDQVAREPGSSSAHDVFHNDVRAARKALDAAIRDMLGAKPADRELIVLREELDDVAGRLAAIMTRHRYDNVTGYR